LLLPVSQLFGKCDVYHFTGNTMPLKWLYKGKTVVTVHDVIPLLEHGHKLTGSKGQFNNKYFDTTIRGSLTYAKKIITVSESSKKDILNICPQADVIVIPNGVDTFFLEQPDESVTNIKKSLKIPNNDLVIVAIGSLTPRKNLKGIIETFEIVTRHIHNCVLAIVGLEKDQIRDREYYHIVEKLSGKILFLGKVSDLQLRNIYFIGDIFFFPSFYEGFGLPLIEAMGAGNAVVSSNVSSLPEIVGDCGETAVPYDIENLANKIIFLCRNHELRYLYKEKSIQRVKEKYTWDRVARDTIAVYEELVR